MPRSYNRPSQIDIERTWMKLRESVDTHEQMGQQKEAQAARDELSDFEDLHPEINFSGLHSHFRPSKPNLVDLERRWMELWMDAEMGKPGANDALQDFEKKHRNLNMNELRSRCRSNLRVSR